MLLNSFLDDYLTGDHYFCYEYLKHKYPGHLNKQKFAAELSGDLSGDKCILRLNSAFFSEIQST